MYDYITGLISEHTPTYIVLENNGIGYLLHVSVNTFSETKPGTVEKLYIHQVIREDAHLFFGFKNANEREVFRLLISVSGIGANTARMMLSSLTPFEVASAIASEKINILQNIKGIGAKTAQRVVVELKDKMLKIQGSEQFVASEHNTSVSEALSALIMLGFPKPQAEKALNQIARENQNLTVEDLIKKALRAL